MRVVVDESEAAVLAADDYEVGGFSSKVSSDPRD